MGGNIELNHRWTILKQRLINSIRKDRSYRFIDIYRFFRNFVIAYIASAGTIFLSRLLAVSSIADIDQRQWLLIFLGGVVLVVFIYLRELYVTKSQRKRIIEQKLIYDCIGGAIEELIELKEKPKNQRAHYISELLKFIEKVVDVILKDEGLFAGEICCNIMIVKNPTQLSLEYFGTRLAGREKIKLPIDVSCPKPRAPEAYTHNKVMYIDDTNSEKIREHFSAKKTYKSIISIPILTDGDEVFAILNIDSTIPYQFQSSDFISKKILPIINPLIDLIKLVRKDFMD